MTFNEIKKTIFFISATIDPNAKLAVMFYIHDGGYSVGNGNEFIYGADFLVENRVILVTINFRLGPFGFLSLGLPKFSGNMGLKDQQMALKWVYDNIEHFGGDRSRITVFGENAGTLTMST